MGAGNIARKLAADLAYVEGAVLQAVGSRTIENARQFAAEFPVSNVHGSYEALAADEDVDVIYVATPHSHHRDNVLLCLAHDKAVLCEKAFTVNTREAIEIIEKAKEKKLFLMEALWTKFLPQYDKLQQILDSGTLGPIRSVLINFGFRPKTPPPARLFDPALAGGTILDIGIYNVFTAMSVLGRPHLIEAHMTPADTGIDEQCAVLFKYEDGAIAQLFSSFSSDLPTEAEISGTRGRLKLTHRFYAPESLIEYYPGRFDTRQLVDLPLERQGWGYQYEARHVCECLRKGITESPVIPFAETLERMEVLDDIRRKAGIRYNVDV